MSDRIVFEHEGQTYSVPPEAYNTDRIILPDRRMFEIGWSETNPPTILQMHEIDQPWDTLSLTAVAGFCGAVLAEKVEQTETP